MDDIAKFLKKINTKERAAILLILRRIHSNDWADLDIMKLSGKDNYYRARKGNYRIVFQKTAKSAAIIKIEKRNDTTYNF